MAFFLCVADNGKNLRNLRLHSCCNLADNVIYYTPDFYYRGLSNWPDEKGYLRDTCLTAQDRFKAYLDYFQINYKTSEHEQ